MSRQHHNQTRPQAHELKILKEHYYRLRDVENEARKLSDEFTDNEKTGFYKAIYSRRDVRSHFTQEPIDEGTLTKILHAAHHAPSVGFSQPWNFILIKDMNTKQKIKESFQKEHKRASELVEDPKRSEYLSLKLEGIMESDVNVCVTYDPTKFGPFIIGTKHT